MALRQLLEQVALDDVELLSAAVRHHLGAAVDAAHGEAGGGEDAQRLAAAAAEVEQRRRAREVRQVGRDALGDLLLGAAVAALELDVAALGEGAGQRRRRRDRPLTALPYADGHVAAAGRRTLSARRRGGPVRVGRQQRRARPRQQLARIRAVRVDLAVEPRVERVVVADHLVEPLLHDRLDVADAVLEVARRGGESRQPLEQDQVEDALPLPQVVLRDLHQRPQQPLEEDEDAAGEAAVAADGEPVVPRPQPAPGLEVARGLVEEVLDPRRARRLVGHGGSLLRGEDGDHQLGGDVGVQVDVHPVVADRS